jgi:hypothetical protein
LTDKSLSTEQQPINPDSSKSSKGVFSYRASAFDSSDQWQREE